MNLILLYSYFFPICQQVIVIIFREFRNWESSATLEFSQSLSDSRMVEASGKREEARIVHHPYHSTSACRKLLHVAKASGSPSYTKYPFVNRQPTNKTFREVLCTRAACTPEAIRICSQTIRWSLLTKGQVKARICHHMFHPRNKAEGVRN